jgi:hypothetical protein
LYVFKVTHAVLPNDFVKTPAWANAVRGFDPSKLWAATIMPGWDDRLAGAGGLRDPAAAFERPRENGAFYMATCQKAAESRPDLVMITSFNEWVEGTQIEPSVTYGDAYLNLTRECVSLLRG